VPLIDVRGLKTYFYTEDGVVRAVDGVDFTIEPEKTLGIVGESGCGKSVTALSIMGLVQSPPGKIAAGEIIYTQDGKETDLTKLNTKGREYRSIRGNEIAMIFQEPMTSLNPVYTIGNQIMEAIILHQHLHKEYPHQLSGGMRQRAMIAMALSCNPSLLIADEPTTALDVTIQAQVLDLMNDLRRDFKASIQFITHDLGVIADMADDVVVMYLGKIVESANVHEIFHNAKHPYTQGLMNSIPSLTTTKKERLIPIKGVVPDPFDVPDICKREVPTLKEEAPGHLVSCWLYT